MLWLLYAFLTAFFVSVRDVLAKLVLRDLDVYVVAWGLRFFAMLFLLPVVMYVGIPPLGSGFWITLVPIGAMYVVSQVLYMKALQQSDISLSVPMLTFSPLFLLVTSPIILGEFPDASGLLGILLIVLGSYVLNISKWRGGVFAPFKALLKDPGPRLMLAVALIWSITSNYDKIALQASSPLMWAFALTAIEALILYPVMLAKSQHTVTLHGMKRLSLVGLAAALTILFHMMAIELALVAYVISVKRLSVLFSVGFGYFVFKERGVGERLLGGAIMVGGVILISLL